MDRDIVGEELLLSFERLKSPNIIMNVVFLNICINICLSKSHSGREEERGSSIQGKRSSESNNHARGKVIAM